MTVGTEFDVYLGGTGQEIKLPRTFPECNNCGGEDAAWVVNFIIEEAGLYPARVVYFNAEGGGSLELLEVAPDGARHLINSGHPNAIVSYVPPELLTDPATDPDPCPLSGDQWQLDFLTPDPEAIHEVQSSVTLLPGTPGRPSLTPPFENSERWAPARARGPAENRFLDPVLPGRPATTCARVLR